MIQGSNRRFVNQMFCRYFQASERMLKHPKLLTSSDLGVSSRDGTPNGQSEILTELSEYGTEITARNDPKRNKRDRFIDNAD